MSRGIFLFLFVFRFALELARGSDQVTYVENACTRFEKWKIGAHLSLEWKNRFEENISGFSNSAHGFSDALALRKKSRTIQNKGLAEYWISRSLFQAGLIHSAFHGFRTLASYPPEPDIIEIQMAALECLNTIQRKYKIFSELQSVYVHLPLLLNNYSDIQNTKKDFHYFSEGFLSKKREVLYEALTHFFLERLSQNFKKEEAEKLLLLFNKTAQKNNPYEYFVQGLFSIRFVQHSKAVASFENFFRFSQGHSFLESYYDQAHLLLARAYFAQKQFDQAALQLKQVKKSSNELVKTLSELAWSYLMDESYKEAIGTALNLESGGLRHTFAPESPMVMAIALNELCQYPESLKAVDVFKKHYESAYQWLSQWYEQAQAPLYISALEFLNFKNKIPERVGSEWIRSPVFITNQEEINLIGKEESLSLGLSNQVAKEQSETLLRISQKITELKPKIKEARARLPLWELLPKSLSVKLHQLKNEIQHYRRVKSAASPLGAMLGFQKKRNQTVSTRLIAEVNKDLKNRSTKMLRELEEIAENNQLIEVEIYNGASEDIIWQNTYPDYKEAARKFKEENLKANSAREWDWGKMPASGDRAKEVWEDELGSFKANLYNNCSSKEKYLALRKKTIAQK